jgi:hypothetical protein
MMDCMLCHSRIQLLPEKIKDGYRKYKKEIEKMSIEANLSILLLNK